MSEPYAIVIAGGGPVGAALALGLRDSSHRVALLESRAVDTVTDDTRVIALSHGSRLILERLGVWQALRDVTPIQTITVSQQRRFGRVELTAAEARVPALGYVASYAALQRTLMSAVTGGGVDVLSGCTAREFNSTADHATVTVDDDGVTRHLLTSLLALADGGESLRLAPMEERDYRQSALVCDVISEAPHENRAFERFTPQGPLALLPTPRGWSLVWTARQARANALAMLDDAQFNAELQAAFGNLLGALRVSGARQLFPLKLKHARRPGAPRVVLIGNAAQSLHPVAGQGFNLGLRDAWELARAVRDAHDPGDPLRINTYFGERRFDRTATILFTDTLIRLFSNDIPLLDRLSSAGISALAAIPPAKNLLVRRMMFGAHG
ncbi:MAG: Ubiquinone biosynthesis hydroxylase, UbiH/UbiF/VisC/COQ6 family [Betaproteobacteria bacterium]|nr:Ubiquinone biosynthesis hydroxylase, UbiH/UbiF/VisC/COQ6 family [Betaproteobacteria bacterium]